MSEKKKRMSMLDSLAAAGAPAPAASMMSSNRALRSARDAVDSHRVWDLDPTTIHDTRPADRISQNDVADLVASIEASGQTVPILVRRHPKEPEQFLLVYGRRRLEAVRRSEKVNTVRALVASLDEHDAVQSQISENVARRDLSFIEKALFARKLVEDGFGNQSQVAAVLAAPKSAISMAISIAERVGEGLIRAIGPAHGIGRPRWEALARALQDTNADASHLISIAKAARQKAEADPDRPDDPSVLAFDAVTRALPRPTTPEVSPQRAATMALSAGGQRAGTVTRTGSGLRIELRDGAFADWVEKQAQDLIEDLHARWKHHAED